MVSLEFIDAERSSATFVAQDEAAMVAAQPRGLLRREGGVGVEVVSAPLETPPHALATRTHVFVPYDPKTHAIPQSVIDILGENLACPEYFAKFPRRCTDTDVSIYAARAPAKEPHNDFGSDIVRSSDGNSQYVLWDRANNRMLPPFKRECHGEVALFYVPLTWYLECFAWLTSVQARFAVNIEGDYMHRSSSIVFPVPRGMELAVTAVCGSGRLFNTLFSPPLKDLTLAAAYEHAYTVVNYVCRPAGPKSAKEIREARKLFGV